MKKNSKTKYCMINSDVFTLFRQRWITFKLSLCQKQQFEFEFNYQFTLVLRNFSLQFYFILRVFVKNLQRESHRRNIFLFIFRFDV